MIEFRDEDSPFMVVLKPAGSDTFLNLSNDGPLILFASFLVVVSRRKQQHILGSGLDIDVFQLFAGAFFLVNAVVGPCLGYPFATMV